jgi:NDP-hexose 4-ketoreductase
MRLLIIGASGFLGAHVWRQAAAAGLEVITAGRTGPGPAGRCRHQRLDLSAADPARIAALLTELAPDAVVNCAGATTGDPGELAALNVTGVYALVRGMLLAGRPGRLIHLGSAAEYGRTEQGVPVHEQTMPRPSGMYGVTKLAGTRLVQVAVAGGLEGVVLRVFNPVGPGAPATSLAGRLAAELRHPVVNIGSGRGVPVRAMVKELLAISGCASPVREDAPDLPRPADIPWQQADITRAAEDLGWAPHRDLATSLADLWEAIH